LSIRLRISDKNKREIAFKQKQVVEFVILRKYEKKMICRKTENKLNRINLRIQACTSCELCNLAYNKKDISKGYGKLYGWRGGQKKCRYMLVGMNPSYNRFAGHEYAFGGVEGSPGPGKKFNGLLKEAGIFEEIFCDNVIHCSSSTNEIQMSWAQACFSHLVDEIDALQPEKIITMGRQVFTMLSDLFREHNIEILIKNIWHPSYVFSYGRSTPDEYKKTILRACHD